MNHVCLACGKTNCLTYLNSKSKTLYCNNCSSIHLEKEDINKNQDFLEYNKQPIFFDKLRTKIINIPLATMVAEEYVQYLKSHTEMNFKNALDIGAQYGVFVNMLNNLGINAYGIESNQKFVSLSKTNKIQWTYFDENFPLEKKFDLICLTQMIYYIRDNYKLLANVKKILNKNGLIFITTINPESLFVKELVRTRMGTHTSNMLFSKKNFESLDNKLNLKLINYSTYRANYDIEKYKSKSKKLTFLKYWLKLKKNHESSPDGNHAFILLQSK